MSFASIATSLHMPLAHVAAVPSQATGRGRGIEGLSLFFGVWQLEVGPPPWLPLIQPEDTLSLLLRQAHSLSCFL